MRKTLVIVNLLLLGLIVTAEMPHAVLGKSDLAPGQVKKAENSHAVVGSVDSVTGSTVVVTDKRSKNRTEALIDKNTKIVGQDKKLLKVGALKLKDLIALISSGSGDATTGGKLKVKKIFVKDATTSAQMKRRAVQGVITAINGNVITLAHQIQRDRTYTVIVNEQTLIKIKSINASASASLSESSASAGLSSLQVGQRIVAVGDLNPDGGIIAKRIHVIPGKATGIFRRLPISTPSASLVGTPSASTLPSSSPSTPSASSTPAPTP